MRNVWTCPFKPLFLPWTSQIWECFGNWLIQNSQKIPRKGVQHRDHPHFSMPSKTLPWSIFLFGQDEKCAICWQEGQLESHTFEGLAASKFVAATEASGCSMRNFPNKAAMRSPFVDMSSIDTVGGPRFLRVRWRGFGPTDSWDFWFKACHVQQCFAEGAMISLTVTSKATNQWLAEHLLCLVSFEAEILGISISRAFEVDSRSKKASMTSRQSSAICSPQHEQFFQRQVDSSFNHVTKR